jgi:hypothetical protein
MQSLIQQIGIRAGTLLMRWRPQTSIAHVYFAAHGVDSSVAAGKTADEQIKMLNNLLQTVCRKLLVKIRELDCVSGELDNLMKVCPVPAIFVDDKLVIRSFTRESRQVYRLSRKDIGRSLHDVTCGLDYYSLGDDFRRVTETGKCVNRYLEKRGCEVRYFLRILPNFCRDNSFRGATLVFNQVADRHWGTA